MNSIVRAVAALLVVFSMQTARAQSGPSIVPSSLAAQLGLERAWAMQLRVDPSRGRVAGVQMTHGLLVAHTTLGTIQAIDPETGRTYWTTSVGRSDFQTLPPAVGNKHIAVVNGSKLYLLNRVNGALLWEQRIGGSAAAGLAIDDALVYVPLDTGIIEAFKLERETRSDEIPQRYSGSGPAAGAPVVTGKRVLWAVNQGHVYSREPGVDLVQFRFRMDDDASTSPAYMSPYVYAASRHGSVYCLNETTGGVIWTFFAENSISHPILTIDGALYVITEKGEMFRLNPQTGDQMWFQRGIARFASAGTGKLYVVDTFGRLAALDAATGSRLGAVPAGEVGKTVVNTETDRIFLVSSAGTVQALRETALAKPLAHTPGYAVPPPPKPGAAPAEGAPADGQTPATEM